MPENYENSAGRQAYEKKYDRGQNKGKYWRMTVCLGIIFFVFTIITIALGISACVISADAVNKDEDSDAEI